MNPADNTPVLLREVTSEKGAATYLSQKPSSDGFSPPTDNSKFTTCSKCGAKFEKGKPCLFSCNRPDCPTFPQITYFP